MKLKIIGKIKLKKILQKKLLVIKKIKNQNQKKELMIKINL